MSNENCCFVGQSKCHYFLLVQPHPLCFIWIKMFSPNNGLLLSHLIRGTLNSREAKKFPRVTLVNSSVYLELISQKSPLWFILLLQVLAESLLQRGLPWALPHNPPPTSITHPALVSSHHSSPSAMFLLVYSFSSSAWPETLKARILSQ